MIRLGIWSRPVFVVEMVGEELRQPLGHLRHRRVRIAVPVEELAVADFEAHVIDTIGNGIHQVLAPVLGGRTVVPHVVENRFLAILVVTVQRRPPVRDGWRGGTGSSPPPPRPELAVGAAPVALAAPDDELVEAVGSRRPFVMSRPSVAPARPLSA